MNIYYRADSDYLEVFKKEGVENYADFEDNGLIVFRSEENDEIVGYGLEAASEHIGLLLKPLYGLERLAVLLWIERKKRGLNQTQAAKLLGIDLRQYQRIENGENTKLDVVLKASKAFPNAHLEAVLMGEEVEDLPRHRVG